MRAACWCFNALLLLLLLVPLLLLLRPPSRALLAPPVAALRVPDRRWCSYDRRDENLKTWRWVRPGSDPHACAALRPDGTLEATFDAIFRRAGSWESRFAAVRSCVAVGRLHEDDTLRFRRGAPSARSRCYNVSMASLRRKKVSIVHGSCTSRERPQPAGRPDPTRCIPVLPPSVRLCHRACRKPGARRCHRRATRLAGVAGGT